MPTAANDYLRWQDLCGYVHDEALPPLWEA